VENEKKEEESKHHIDKSKEKEIIEGRAAAVKESQKTHHLPPPQPLEGGEPGFMKGSDFVSIFNFLIKKYLLSSPMLFKKKLSSPIYSSFNC
jgi:hypothetical protein